MSKVLVEKVKTIKGHTDCLYTLAARDDRRFFSAGADGMVVEWDLSDPEDGQLIAKIPSSIYSLCYIVQKGRLILGQNFSGIHLIDVESKKETGSLQLTTSAIFDIKHHHDKILVATGSGEVLVVHEDLQIIKRLHHSDKSARTIEVLPNQNQFAVGYSDNHIRIFDLESFELIKELDAHKISVFALKMHPNGKLLLSGSRDAHVKIWETTQYGLVDSIVAHMYAINHIDFSPNGEHFVTCSMDKSIKVWDASSFKLLKVIDRARHAGHGTSVNRLLWMKHQNWLVSCSDDRTISVWDINT
ncbi:MAG: WD40 repeat domain-containing protein [Cyclobacteriaceae bacterium]|nr:WD40 repeat domain-containing protein [Cyclobacteriaceae bacterium HetDA_MAG_MS6]